MGDNRRQVQTRLDQCRHLVPGFEHLAAVDTFDEQPLEDNLVPVDRHIRRWNAQHRNTPAVVHGVQHGAKRRWCAGHLKTHVKTFGHAQLFHHVAQALF